MQLIRIFEESISCCDESQSSESPSSSLSYDSNVPVLWQAAWSPSGDSLAVCGSDRVIRIYRFSNDQLHLSDRLVKGHIRTIRSVQFDPSGHRLAAASFDGTVTIWSKGGPQGWRCTATLEGHENEVKALSWSPDQRWLATCGRDKTVWIWEVIGEDGEEEEQYECSAVLPDHLQDVKQVQWCPNGDKDPLLLSCSYDETVRLWTRDPVLDEWYCAASLTGHASTVWAVAWEPSGEAFASVSDDQCMVIWRRLADRFEPAQRLWNAHSRPIYSVSWTTQATTLSIIATCSGDRSLAVWTEDDSGEFGLAVRVEDAQEAEINCVSWHPKLPILAACSDDGRISLWKL